MNLALTTVIDSLEKSAEIGNDLSESIYSRFFSGDEQAATLMSHCDTHMLGRMLEQVYAILMDEDLQNDSEYFQWEVGNHLSYGVTRDMYEPFLAAVHKAVSTDLGENWSSDYEQAWQTRIGEILTILRAHGI
jgi:hypothetical protein